MSSIFTEKNADGESWYFCVQGQNHPGTWYVTLKTGMCTKKLVRLTSLAASCERNDGRISLFSDAPSIQVHVACRKHYTCGNSIAAVKRKRSIEDAAECRPLKSGMESSAASFDFEKLCIFSGNEADEEKEKKHGQDVRKKIHYVSTSGFRETIMKTVEGRKDEQARAVEKRIISETDLVAAKAKYHKHCFNRFLQPLTGKKSGRPVDVRIIATMENVFSYIENHDDCQFTLNELKGVLGDFQPDDKTIKTKLQERYGDRIVITTRTTKPSIICFRETRYDILNEEWYESRKNNAEEERHRLLAAAAAILRQDIRSVACETRHHPPSARMFDDVNNSVPESLIFFVEEIIAKNKKGNLEPLRRKCTAISHAIMSAVRPRSFMSPLQIGLAVYLRRQFASERLIDILSCLGFCAPYKETNSCENFDPPELTEYFRF